MTDLFTKDELEYLQSIKFFVATPAYGESVSVYFARSLALLMSAATAYGIPLSFSTIGNESLVTRARNEMVGEFLASDATHLMFIDADISFDPVDVFRLALPIRDVVAAAYPTKGLAWERAVGAKTEIEAAKSTINYVINLDPELTKNTKEDGMLDVKLEDGLLEVMDAGTGFMLIYRGVFDKLREEYGDEIAYVSDSATVQNDGTIVRETVERHAYFDTSIEVSTGRYLSEDYTFCRRWQSVGGRIFIDPKIILNHHGTFTYRGYPLI